MSNARSQAVRSLHKLCREAWPKIPRGVARPRACAEMQDFPLLLKFIFPTDKLSIQVHPDDDYARIHEASSGGRGKTEMWHIVSAKPGAELLLGLKSGVTKKEFSAAIGSKSLEDLFSSAAGRRAANLFYCSANSTLDRRRKMVVFEVQQYSDLTYRVYDYGPSRCTGPAAPTAHRQSDGCDSIWRSENRQGAFLAVGVAKRWRLRC